MLTPYMDSNQPRLSGEAKKAYSHELITDFKKNNSIVNSTELFLYLLQDFPGAYD